MNERYERGITLLEGVVGVLTKMINVKGRVAEHHPVFHSSHR